MWRTKQNNEKQVAHHANSLSYNHDGRESILNESSKLIVEIHVQAALTLPPGDSQGGACEQAFPEYHQSTVRTILARFPQFLDHAA